MNALFSIEEEDLATLERVIPELLWKLGEKANDTKVRVQSEKCKEILSNVRWRYGPPREVMIIPLDEGPKENHP